MTRAPRSQVRFENCCPYCTGTKTFLVGLPPSPPPRTSPRRPTRLSRKPCSSLSWSHFFSSGLDVERELRADEHCANRAPPCAREGRGIPRASPCRTVSAATNRSTIRRLVASDVHDQRALPAPVLEPAVRGPVHLKLAGPGPARAAPRAPASAVSPRHPRSSSRVSRDTSMSCSASPPPARTEIGVAGTSFSADFRTAASLFECPLLCPDASAAAPPSRYRRTSRFTCRTHSPRRTAASRCLIPPSDVAAMIDTRSSSPALIPMTSLFMSAPVTKGDISTLHKGDITTLR